MTWSVRLMSVPLCIVVLAGFTIPILLTLSLSVAEPTWGITNYLTLLSESTYLLVLVRSLKVAFETAAICGVLGYIFCYWVHRQPRPILLAALALVLLSFWVSVLVRTYAWIVLLGNNGIVNQMLQASELQSSPVRFLYNEFGVLIGMTNVLLPIFILPVLAAMIKIDKHLMVAARTLGASELTVFRKIFFPLTVSASLNACFLVLVIAVGFYITPAILGGGRVPMVANLIDTLINRMSEWGLAAALSTILLVISFGILYGARALAALFNAGESRAR